MKPMQLSGSCRRLNREHNTDLKEKAAALVHEDPVVVGTGKVSQEWRGCCKEQVTGVHFGGWQGPRRSGVFQGFVTCVSVRTPATNIPLRRVLIRG